MIWTIYFTECNCSPNGRTSESCDSSGQCACKQGFDGVKCNKCQSGYEGLKCESCQSGYLREGDECVIGMKRVFDRSTCSKRSKESLCLQCHFMYHLLNVSVFRHLLVYFVIFLVLDKFRHV